jgi:hypothetical protein
MVGHIVEFIATGTPRSLARSIEEHATRLGSVSVLVVPWESDETTWSMAVTLVNADGWAIEHTNLGTVKLTDLGHDRTRVLLSAHSIDHAERDRVSPLLDDFGRQIQRRFEAVAGRDADGTPPFADDRTHSPLRR